MRILLGIVLALSVSFAQTDKKEIQAGTFFDYNKQHFPKLYAKWGDDNIDRIMRLERAAAEKVATSQNACDSIHTASLSENKSSKSEMVIYVDCENGTRIYVSEREINID